MSGLRLRFDVDFEDGAWPGPLGTADVVVGERWVGPSGLLGQLETSLGLGGTVTSAIERAVGLIRPLMRVRGYWSESASADPLATARRLLDDRDFLWMCGWRGEAVSERLGQLAAITDEAAPGVADRVAAVAATLQRRSVDIERIDLSCSEDELPPLWREVLARLREQGSGVSVSPPAAAPTRSASSDLAGARGSVLAPVGDGSVQLLRPYGPMHAADLVAAWLAHGSGDGADLHQTVIVGADPLLDSALHRFGLPTVGAKGSCKTDAVLQILPCVLDLAWDPPDPRAAWNLLTLPASPVPKTIAAKLLQELGKWPSTSSDGWKAALQAGLDAVDDEAARGRLQARLQGVLEPTVARSADTYPADELRRRAELVARFALGRSRGHDDDECHEHREHGDPGWEGGLKQCRAFSRFVDLMAMPSISPSTLRQLLEAATLLGGGTSPYPAQAGLAAVKEPGGVAGPADTVVWWNFTRDSARPPGRSSLDPAERAALAEKGIQTPEPGVMAEQQAARQWRPLQQARSRVLFVCPQHNSAGEEASAHPLWDEIEAKLPDEHRDRALARLVVSEPAGLVTSPCTLAPLPTLQRDWTSTKRSIPPRATESPSGIEKLLGCPLAWTLRYTARLEGTALPPIAPPGPLLYGRLVHRILERVLPQAVGQGAESPSRAAGAAFDAMGPTLAGQLFVPGAESERDLVRQVVCASAKSLTALVCAARMSVVAMEKKCERAALGTQLRGYADVVLGPAPAVIDLKWGRKTERTNELRRGGALQLAAYSMLLTHGPHARVPVAYFILNSQRLLTQDSERFGGVAAQIDGPSPAETWQAAEAAYALRRAELDRGLIVATGGASGPSAPAASAGSASPESSQTPAAASGAAGPATVDGVLQIPPPCQYCDYGALCGLAFGEEA